MSVRASTAVWDYSRSPNNTVLVVALVLADHADYDGKVWMSIASVAVQARAARSTVYSAISTLEALGELERLRQGGRTGPGDVTTYRLTLVDKLRRGVRHTDPSTRPKGVQKGSDCVDLKRSSVDTKTRDQRARDLQPDWDDPDLTDSTEVEDKVEEIRHGRHLSVIDEETPA